MNTEIINNETYNMKSDIIFKEVFSKPGNEDILIDFLEGILDLKITKLEVLKESSHSEVSNADLLRRLSNLEKIIYSDR